MNKQTVSSVVRAKRARNGGSVRTGLGCEGQKTLVTVAGTEVHSSPVHLSLEVAEGCLGP